MTGYEYAPALLKKSQKGWYWDEESLNRWLENPKKTAPGTRMLFNGIKDPRKRASLIAYLKTMKK